MGTRMPETCWAVFKRQVINLRSCCILLVDSVESMMMHGLANPKFYGIWRGPYKVIPNNSYHASASYVHVVFLWPKNLFDSSTYTKYNFKNYFFNHISTARTCSCNHTCRINPLNAELNPICYLLGLLAHHFLHVSRITVKSLTLRLLMSYIYIWSAYSWCF